MAVSSSGRGIDASSFSDAMETPRLTRTPASSVRRRRRRRRTPPGFERLVVPQFPLLSLLLTGTLLYYTGGAPVVHAINNTIPPENEVIENLMLSSLLYQIHNCNDTASIPTAQNLTCHHYEQKHDGTQVAVLSNPAKNYVVVSYAGTDNAYDVILDVDVKMEPFGPRGAPLKTPAGDKIRVHGGFNAAVFGDGLYTRILDVVHKVLSTNPTYRILVTGHSLGAADSVLTAVAFATQQNAFPHRQVSVINFGCPRTSNHHFRTWANSLDNLSLWRFVHRNDIVPRIPFPVWKHPGHTIQLYKRRAAAYYLHEGDEELGYAGVPVSWQSGPWATLPTAGYHHILSSYEDYILTKSCVDPGRYYVDGFVTRGSAMEEELELESVMEQEEEEQEEEEWDYDDDVAVVAEEEWDDDDDDVAIVAEGLLPPLHGRGEGEVNDDGLHHVAEAAVE